jgi:peptide/nickel transport system permease protein
MGTSTWVMSLKGLWGETLARYLVRRLIMLIGVVFVITVGAFYLIHLLPGDPAAVILGTGDSPANKAKLYKQLGLNKPVIEQYFVWIKNVLRGNLGTSFITETSVWSTIKAALPIDLEIIVLSQILAFAAAIPTAMRSARKPDGVLDRILSAGSFTLLSVPSFVLIVVLVLVVAIKLGVPHTGVSSYVSLGADWVENLESLALPSITLAIGSYVVYYRVLRSDLIATLQDEFITMARSKGISQRRIMWRHAFRPSSVSLLGTAGVNIGGLLAGGFIVQYLLSIPGLGYQLIAAIGTSNYLVVQGIVLIVSVGVIVINFAFDLAINIVDPRISRE